MGERLSSWRHRTDLTERSEWRTYVGWPGTPLAYTLPSEAAAEGKRIPACLAKPAAPLVLPSELRKA